DLSEDTQPVEGVEAQPPVEPSADSPTADTSAEAPAVPPAEAVASAEPSAAPADASQPASSEADAAPLATEPAEGQAPAVAAAAPVAAPAAPPDAAPAPAEPVPEKPALPDWAVPFAQLGEAPISDSEPVGENMTHEALFEAIEEEIGRPQSVEPQPTNWSVVESKSRELLEGRSKDLKVACYLARGLAETKGARGLACGALLLERMISTFGGDVWPRRFRGRNAALAFFTERALELADAIEPKAADVPIFELAAERSKAAHLATKEALVEEGKPFDSLVQVRKWSEALAELHRGAVKSAEAARNQAQAKAQSSAPSGGGGGGGLSFQSVDDVRRGDSALRKELKKAAELLVEADTGSATGYRMARFAIWPEKLKFEVKGQTSSVPGKEQADLDASLTKLEGLEGEEGIKATEKAIRTTPWILDLQRVLVQKLEAQGPSHEAAMGAVVGELLALTKRLPEILDLTFSNGVPFASPATRAWLDQWTASAGGGEGAASGVQSEGDDVVAEAAKAAKAATAKNDLRGALEAYQLALSSSGAPDVQFRLRLGLAKTCLENRQAALALPHLDDLRAELRSRTLGDWAPSLAVEVLGASYQALRAAAGKNKSDQTLRARAAEVLGELSRLDPLAALEFDS
ncbi:MAG: type VI secretion system protein TssA, partial [Planctomycetota bacterium]